MMVVWGELDEALEGGLQFIPVMAKMAEPPSDNITLILP